MAKEPTARVQAGPAGHAAAARTETGRSTAAPRDGTTLAIQSSPKMVAQARELRRLFGPATGASAPRGSAIVQAKGFARVNGKAGGFDANEQAIATAGLAAWDTVFPDDAIDRAGGILGELTHSAGAEIKADATTRHEAPMPHGAFARVTAQGDVNAGTTVDRWSKQTIMPDDVLLPADTLAARKASILTSIQALLDTGQNAQPEDQDEAASLDGFLLLAEGTLPDWYAGNKLKRQPIVRLIFEHLEARLGERNRKLTASLFEACCPPGDQTTAPLLYQAVVAAAGVAPVPRQENVPLPVALSINEVVMHEFGHVKAALDVTEDGIQGEKAKLAPTLASAVALARTLKVRVGAGLSRDELTRFRFGWARVVTDWYGVKDRPEYNQIRAKTTDGLKTMQNVLMSLEEYKNIQSIDNEKAAGSAGGMRLRHGTENLTLLQMGQQPADVLEKGHANTPESLAGTPLAMSERVWRTKMNYLLDAFIGAYGT